MLERTVVSAVTTVGEAAAQRLVGLNPSHAIYTPWRKLRLQLAKSSCAPLFLIVVCSRLELIRSYLGMLLMLRAIRADGYLPAIVALAVCDHDNMDDFHPGSLGRLADDLGVETRQCNRVLTWVELQRGDGFARSGSGNFLLPSNTDVQTGPWSSVTPVVDPKLTTYVKLIEALLANEAARSELDRIVPRDFTTNVNGWTGSEQLHYCLVDLWQAAKATDGTKDELDLALCIYTSYFYSALNRSLRDGSVLFGARHALIRRLLIETHDWLMAGYRVSETGPIRTYRLECKAGWMGSKDVGDTLPFDGFTSTHTAIDNLNAMPGDVHEGVFGDVDQPAILVFEGHCPVLLPVVKYFESEVEYVLPAGIEMLIKQKYSLKWKLLKSAPPCDVTIYHLQPVYLPPPVPPVQLVPVQLAPSPSSANPTPQVAARNAHLLRCKVSRDRIAAPEPPTPTLQGRYQLTLGEWSPSVTPKSWKPLCLTRID